MTQNADKSARILDWKDADPWDLDGAGYDAFKDTAMVMFGLTLSRTSEDGLIRLHDCEIFDECPKAGSELARRKKLDAEVQGDE